jgi:predicted RNA polymerase sigma factor
MAYGAQPALELLDPLLADPLMQNYHLLPSVRGDFLARLGRHAEASAEFQRAASLTRNAREQVLLTERARTSEEKAREQSAMGLNGHPSGGETY